MTCFYIGNTFINSFSQISYDLKKNLPPFRPTQNNNNNYNN